MTWEWSLLVPIYPVPIYPVFRLTPHEGIRTSRDWMNLCIFSSSFIVNKYWGCLDNVVCTWFMLGKGFISKLLMDTIPSRFSLVYNKIRHLLVLLELNDILHSCKAELIFVVLYCTVISNVGILLWRMRYSQSRLILDFYSNLENHKEIPKSSIFTFSRFQSLRTKFKLQSQKRLLLSPDLFNL